MKLSAADAALKKELDRRRKQNERPEFIESDPAQFPHRYKKRADIEIAAFLAATIAWGRRDLILRSSEKMFALLGPSPAECVCAGGFRKPSGGHNSRGRNIHRTFFESDLAYFCRGFRSCYAKYGSLEKLFARGMAADGGAGDAAAVWRGIALFREEMAAANGGRYTKHIANPDSSACKRIHLALRWLARPGPVDLGLWKTIPPAALCIPLDVHVARTARRLGLLRRKSNDKKAVIELTAKLREFCPEDPVRYDFALFSM
jgi:uncharacterized protein (TIGR02757 family)